MEFQSIADRPLSADDIGRLTVLVRGNESFVVRERAHGVLLLFKGGRTYEDVASIFDVHPNTVRNWAERWVGGGIDGLYDRPGRGAKPMFDAAEKDFAVTCVEEEPRSLRTAIARIARVTGKCPSPDTLREILKSRGKSWKRERKIPKGQPTEEEYAQGKADLAELQRLARDGEFKLTYFDEAGFGLDPAVPYAWQDIGRDGTQGIPASRSGRIDELAFLDPADNSLRAFAHTGTIGGDVVVEVMDAYCDELEGPAVVALDNAPVHRSRAVQDRRPEWERRGLTLHFLPRYSPQLNPIEIVWRKFKHEWIPPSAYAGLDFLQDALKRIVASYGTTYKIQFSF